MGTVLYMITASRRNAVNPQAAINKITKELRQQFKVQGCSPCRGSSRAAKALENICGLDIRLMKQQTKSNKNIG